MLFVFLNIRGFFCKFIFLHSFLGVIYCCSGPLSIPFYFLIPPSYSQKSEKKSPNKFSSPFFKSKNFFFFSSLLNLRGYLPPEEGPSIFVNSEILDRMALKRQQQQNYGTTNERKGRQKIVVEEGGGRSSDGGGGVASCPCKLDKKIFCG